MTENVDLLIASLLIIFCVLGAIDGLYFHLIKYRLHENPESRKEHILHTIRGFGFVPLALTLFVFNTGGLLLYAAIALVIVDCMLELLDILEEKKSRVKFGGISSSESAIHVFASSFRFAAIALVLAFKPIEAYNLNAPALLSPFETSPLAITGILLTVGSFLGSIHSIWDYRTCTPCKVQSAPDERPTQQNAKKSVAI